MKWQPTPVFLPGEFHGERSLTRYSLQGCKESDTTKVTQHTCIYIGNLFQIIFHYGTSFQYSCLENPMDGGAWLAAVHGVTKSQTRLSDFLFTFMHWRRKWQPTPVFLLGKSQGRGSLMGCGLWGCTESDTTEVTQQQQLQQQCVYINPLRLYIIP